MYRRVCRVDAQARALGQLGPPRLEYMTGSEEDMRFYFAEFANNPQVLAAELRNDLGAVVERFDRLVAALPALEQAQLRAAVLEPALLRHAPAPLRPAE
jgi:hypothetical protein